MSDVDIPHLDILQWKCRHRLAGNVILKVMYPPENDVKLLKWSLLVMYIVINTCTKRLLKCPSKSQDCAKTTLSTLTWRPELEPAPLRPLRGLWETLWGMFFPTYATFHSSWWNLTWGKKQPDNYARHTIKASRLWPHCQFYRLGQSGDERVIWRRGRRPRAPSKAVTFDWTLWALRLNQSRGEGRQKDNNKHGNRGWGLCILHNRSSVSPAA